MCEYVNIWNKRYLFKLKCSITAVHETEHACDQRGSKQTDHSLRLKMSEYVRSYNVGPSNTSMTVIINVLKLLISFKNKL